MVAKYGVLPGFVERYFRFGLSCKVVTAGPAKFFKKTNKQSSGETSRTSGAQAREKTLLGATGLLRISPPTPEELSGRLKSGQVEYGAVR